MVSKSTVHPMAPHPCRSIKLTDFAFIGSIAALMAVPFMFLALLGPAGAQTRLASATAYPSTVTTICLRGDASCNQIWYGHR